MSNIADREPVPPAPPAHARVTGLADEDPDDIDLDALTPLHAGRPALPGLPEDAHGFIPVLRRADFRMLWAAQAASQLADKFLMFTLLLVVYELSHRNALQSLLMLAYTLPSVVLSAPAGVYADRHDKRTLMIATNVVRAGLVLLIPLTQWVPGLEGDAWPLLLVVLLFSAVGQVFAPAEAASIPFLVRRPQIMAATSLFMTTVIVTLVAGVPLATLSVKLLGQNTPFYMACGLFILAAVFIARVRTSLRARRHHAESHALAELREGLLILGRDPALRMALAQLTLALVVVFTVFALGPAYMRTVLRRDPADTYLVLIPATLGMVATALLLGQRARRLSRARVLVRGLVCGGAALVGIGLVPDALRAAGWLVALTPVAVVVSAVFGVALGMLLIPAFTVLQERTTEQTRGRIFGGIFTVINAAVALPLLLAGGLADGFGVDRVVAGFGMILLLGALAARGWGGAQLAVLDAPQAPAGAVDAVAGRGPG